MKLSSLDTQDPTRGLRALPDHQRALSEVRAEVDRVLPQLQLEAGSGVLVIEDSPAYALRTRAHLQQSSQDWGEVVVAHDLATGRERLAERSFALVLCDLDLPDSEGLETVQAVLERSGEAAVVVLSGSGNEAMGMQAVGAGAQDYVVKGRDHAEVLERVLVYALERRAILNRVRRVLDQHREDLAAAAEVQRSLFPLEMPELPGFACAWSHQPSQLVSGDICNLVPLDEHRFACYLLDVMGHGVSAALLACQISRLLLPGPGSALYRDGEPARPDEVLEVLNRRFQMADTGGRFFTMAYALVDGRDGRVAFANAGHPPLLCCRADGGVEELRAAGIAVGMAPDVAYRAGEAQLAPGDRLVLYSDGLAEGRNTAGEQFGEERLARCLGDRTRSLDGALGSAMWSCAAWSGSSADQDDRTLVAVERRKTGPELASVRSPG